MPRLPPLDPAVALTRTVVRRALAGALPPPPELPGALVLVALSGGADSLALAAATAVEAPRAGHRVGAVVVDHGLQAASASVAAQAARVAAGLGLCPVLVRRVRVSASGGPEAAARQARYAALAEAAEETGATLILTAHTRDDQAEQVLLALARGSGLRSIAGIPLRRGRILRPFLDVPRSAVEAACAAQGLRPWRDPHNADPAFARVRVRERLLPALERELGPGVSAALARTAALAREDADALDALAAEVSDRLSPGTAEAMERGRDPSSVRLPVAELAALPGALRSRVIRRIGAGFGAQLSRDHTLAITTLVTAWRGQGPIDVPGIQVRREGASLVWRARNAPSGPRT